MYAYYPSKRILTCFFLLTFIFITPAAWASDHGNSIQSATPVGPNSTTVGRIDFAGDNDFFRINVPGSGTLTVNTTGSTDTYGHLLDGNGRQLAENDDAGGALGRNFRISRSVSAGTYYVRVRHYSSSGTGAYTLVVAFSGTPPPPPPPPPSGDDHGDSIQRATPVGPNSTTAGRINPAGDNDFFRINVPGSGTLTVNTTGSTDTYGYLLDGNGRQLAENDDISSTNRNFRISRSVSAGTYYVRVRHYSSGGTGAYSLVVAFSGTTPPPASSQRVILLLHGMNSSENTWNDLVENVWEGHCPTISGPILIGDSVISQATNAKNSVCYRIRFGYFDRSNSAVRGLENITCTRTGGCGGDFTNIIANSGNDLGVEVRMAISRIRSIYQNPEIVLLGHSRGGLAARSFLQRPVSSPEHRAVVGLITTGTPHLGSPLGRVYQYLSSQCMENGARWLSMSSVRGRACTEDWSALEELRLITWIMPGSSLDLRSPVINMLATGSGQMNELSRTRTTMDSRNIETRTLGYAEHYLGHLALGYSTWNRPWIAQAFKQFSNRSKNYVLCENVTTCNKTENDTEFDGDGIVPRNSQRGGDNSPWSSTTYSLRVFHTAQPKRTGNLRGVINELRVWR